jgi:hypothetical protein
LFLSWAVLFLLLFDKTGLTEDFDSNDGRIHREKNTVISNHPRSLFCRFAAISISIDWHDTRGSIEFDDKF